MMKRLGLLAAFALLAAAPAHAASLRMEVSKGCSFSIALNEKAAPRHVAQVTALAAKGFYDGIIFHRVIDGFMAQTGDPTGTGTGGSDLPDIAAEFSGEHFGRGAVGMARSQDPNSANSQFFIMFADGGFLDGQYTVWGQVGEEGMKCVDLIEKGEPPAKPDKIIKMSVE